MRDTKQLQVTHAQERKRREREREGGKKTIRKHTHAHTHTQQNTTNGRSQQNYQRIKEKEREEREITKSLKYLGRESSGKKYHWHQSKLHFFQNLCCHEWIKKPWEKKREREEGDFHFLIEKNA